MRLVVGCKQLFMFLVLWLPAAAGGRSDEHIDDEVRCDIVVAGGSTASLAAAITAAEAAPELIICFPEITDWPWKRPPKRLHTDSQWVPPRTPATTLRRHRWGP
jgi:hypothetical protein